MDLTALAGVLGALGGLAVIFKGALDTIRRADPENLKALKGRMERAEKREQELTRALDTERTERERETHELRVKVHGARNELMKVYGRLQDAQELLIKRGLATQEEVDALGWNLDDAPARDW